MKSFYEMMQILESEAPFTYHVHHSDPNERDAYEKIGQALKGAGLPWDKDEGEVLYGKWVDLTLRVGASERRVKGVVLPAAVSHDFDSERGGRSEFVQYSVGGVRFSMRDIAEIHEVKAHTSYDDLWKQYYDMEEEQWDGRPGPGTYSFDRAERM